jgi:MarR family transcriptional regulator, organic hydroperoxide resistance regulator
MSARDAASRPHTDSLMFAVLEAANVVAGRLEDALATVGLSMAKYGVLAELADTDDPLALGELAEMQSCVRSNMTQIVDRLEREGLVRRVDDPADRRIVRAELTPAGEERQREGARQVKRVEREFLGALSEADRKALARGLKLIG